ncbi:hypothetical protein KIW84_060109 [Lathyrus oleraceus]|uniref:Uncharacterized protein n=1 Tax=Pisum sativum TaxID=3888 RepID=A0A9D4W0G5_PEA|nr:hypothetical protein KIW84_060109 [Pisum sativum]
MNIRKNLEDDLVALREKKDQLEDAKNEVVDAILAIRPQYFKNVFNKIHVLKHGFTSKSEKTLDGVRSKMDPNMIADMASLPAEDQQRMASMIDQLQVRDSTMVANFVLACSVEPY